MVVHRHRQFIQTVVLLIERGNRDEVSVRRRSLPEQKRGGIAREEVVVGRQRSQSVRVQDGDERIFQRVLQTVQDGGNPIFFSRCSSKRKDIGVRRQFQMSRRYTGNLDLGRGCRIVRVIVGQGFHVQLIRPSSLISETTHGEIKRSSSGSFPIDARIELAVGGIHVVVEFKQRFTVQVIKPQY